MNTQEKKMRYLLRKVQQHEETIAQLLLMVAEMNRKLTTNLPSTKKTSQTSS